MLSRAMQSPFPLLLLSALLRPGHAASRTEPPSGCLHVSSSGSGTHTTVQSAVDSLSTSDGAAQCVFLSPGTYYEQVLVSERAAQLTFYGYTTDDTSYGANEAVLSGSLSQNDGLSNDETATLRVKADGFKIYNVDVENTYGEGSQAVAASVYADAGFYGCRLTGYQDTLLSNEGNQLYAKCLIEGATDFIFGQEARSWFEAVDVRVVEKSIGYITANGRDAEDNESYYLFNDCDVAAADGDDVPDGAYYLGRPWREYARVVFQNTAMSAVINEAGWRVWNDDDPNTEHVYYGEYANTGEGAEGDRADFSTALSAAVTIEEILGSGYASEPYYDGAYM